MTKLRSLTCHYSIVLLIAATGCSSIKGSQHISSQAHQARSLASADLGTPLKIKLKPNGKLSFGASYTMPTDPDGMNFLLTYTTTLTSQDLNSAPSELRWNIYLADKDAFLFDWNAEKTILKSQLILNQFLLKDAEALKKLLPSLGHSNVVIADAANHPLYNLNVGEICQQTPQYFVNLTDGPNGKKCFEIKEADIQNP